MRSRTNFIFLGLAAAVLSLVGGWVASNLSPETQAIFYAAISQDERDAKLFDHLSNQMSLGLPITEAEKELLLELESQIEPDRDSRSTLDNQGGPDAFQYVYRDNIAPDDVPYEWIELRDDESATWLPASAFYWSITADDGYSRQKLPIGFSFPFYGTSYDCVRVATNGFLEFTATSYYYDGACMPNSNIPGPAIAMFWDDLHMLRGGRPDTLVIGYKNFGTHFVIEFDHIGFYTPSCTTGTWLTFEAILYPNGSIKLQYNNITPPTACANSQTIGIQSAGTTGAAALNYVCNTTGIQPVNGLAIEFARAAGIPNPCTNLAGNYTSPNVVLTWTDPTTDTQGNAITVQNVEVWLGSVGTGTLLSTVNAGVQTYSHLNAPTGSNIYTVRPYLSPYYGGAVSTTVIVGNPGYANNFDTDNGGWVASPATGGWECGVPTYASGPPAAHSGTNVWGTVLASTYAVSCCYTLTLSPGLAVTSPTAAVEFWAWYNIEGDFTAWDGCNFKVSVDNGTTWQQVSPQPAYDDAATNAANVCIPSEPSWNGTTVGAVWRLFSIPIGQFAGQVPMFRFSFGSDGSGQYAGFYLDDLIIWGVGNQSGIPNPCTNFTGNYVAPNIALNWTDPTMDTHGNPMTVDSIQVWLGNAGTGTWLASVGPGVQSYVHTDAPHGLQTYSIRAYNDGFPSTPVSVSVQGAPPVYPNDFESDNGGWIADPLTGGWEWGVPTYSSGPTAHSGTKVWGTVLAGTYAAGCCYKLTFVQNLPVTSPDASITFWRWWDTEQAYDGANFKVSVDEGATWTLVQPEGNYPYTASTSNVCIPGEPYWAGHTGNAWTQVTIPLGQFLGQIPWFRFSYGSDGSINYAGFYFDDMNITGFGGTGQVPRAPTNLAGNYVSPNVVFTWTDPTLDVMGNPVTLTNLQVWLGQTGTGQLLGTVNPGVQTYTHVNAPAGHVTYAVRAYANPNYGPGASVNVTVGTPSYTMDFETDGGGWVSSGGGAIWQWGAPTVGTGGPAPHGGANCWGTVLTGTYPVRACEFLDLNLGMPVTSPAASINFWYWIDGESSYDGVNFKVSTDGGSTWTTMTPAVGPYQEDAFSTTNACTPSEPGWNGRDSTWRQTEILIGQFMGQTPIFRLTFGSDPSVQYRGFFFDDMEIWGLRPAASITGTVRSYGNNQPIADASVWAVGQPDTAMTDGNGAFILSVEPGTYSVTFDHPYYCDTTYNNVVVETGSETVRNAVMRAPHGQVSISSMEIETAPGVSIQDTFQITNPSGQCPLDFTITDTSTWLTVTPPSGQVITNQTANVIVHVNPTGMTVGDYSSTMVVTYNSTGSPHSVRINLHIANAAGDQEPIPTEFAYYQNYPNPFNAQTVLKFDVPQMSRVRITVYNIMGQEVAHPVDDIYAPGRYRVLYDASSLPSGMYLVKMSSADFEKVGKMMLIK